MKRIVIKNGVAQAIYSDDLLPYIQELEKHGTVVIKRASRVEPMPVGQVRYYNDARWYIDLSPSGGPGCITHDEQRRPFLTRQQALDYEERWLNINVLGIPPATPAIRQT